MNKLVRRLTQASLAVAVALVPAAALAETYDVKVKTGDADWAGTNANVWITLFATLPASQQPVDSGQIQLVNIDGKNDFTRNSTRVFRITTPANIKLANIYGMKVDQDDTGKEPDWFLKSIEVKNVATNKTVTFLCNGWLGKQTGNSRYLKPYVNF